MITLSGERIINKIYSNSIENYLDESRHEEYLLVNIIQNDEKQEIYERKEEHGFWLRVVRIDNTRDFRFHDNGYNSDG